MKPNMTPASLREWKRSDAYEEYRADRGAVTVDGVVRRTMRVLKGRGRSGERKKVENFIKRHRKQKAGEPKYGSGPTAVSAHTCALRNWGFDPTGRYS